MAERVIWERAVDEDKARSRQERFQRFFLIPAAVVIVATLIFYGWQNMIGAIVVLAILGLAWRTTIRFQTLSDAANPVMVVSRGKIVLGQAEVVISEVKKFTTLSTSIQTSLFGKYSRVRLGKALFRLDEPGTRRDPQIVEFGWPNMDEDGVATVQEALVAELPGKWVEPHELVAKEDLPRRSRRHRLS